MLHAEIQTSDEQKKYIRITLRFGIVTSDAARRIPRVFFFSLQNKSEFNFPLIKGICA